MRNEDMVPQSWLTEVEQTERFLEKSQGKLPPALWDEQDEHRSIRQRLLASIP